MTTAPTASTTVRTRAWGTTASRDEARYELSSTRIRWRAARRRAVAPRSGRPANASAWRTRAADVTSTLAPATRARHARLRSSPRNEIASSNPPTSAKRVARTSVNAPGTANTSRRPSCWPWSSSPRSTNGRATPTLSTVRPNWVKRRGASHCTSFGPDDVGVPLVGGGHEGADRTGIGGGVVVGEDEELRARTRGRGRRWRPRRSPGPRRPDATRAAGSTAWTRSVGSSDAVSITRTSRFG